MERVNRGSLGKRKFNPPIAVRCVSDGRVLKRLVPASVDG